MNTKTHWQAGTAVIDITPEEPIYLGGFGHPARPVPAQETLHPIALKALALRDGQGTRSVVVSADLLGFSDAMCRAITARCASECGLPRERVMLAATHTHSAPVLGEFASSAYIIEEENRPAIARYTERVVASALTAIRSALEAMQPATLEHGMGFCGLGVNRRRTRPQTRHFPGPVDQDVPVLVARDLSGAIFGIICGYACHATSLGDNAVSGDWPGFAQSEIERLHPGAVCLFVPGCAGDINPLPRMNPQSSYAEFGAQSAAAHARLLGRLFAVSVHEAIRGLFVQPSLLEPVLQARFAAPEMPLGQVPGSEQEIAAMAQEMGDACSQRWAELMLRRLQANGRLAATQAVDLQVWKLGGTLTWVALGGEPCVDYGLRLKQRYGAETTWVSGYANHGFGYLPTSRIVREGGYEARDSIFPMGLPGAFGEDIEERVMAEIEQLAAEFR